MDNISLSRTVFEIFDFKVFRVWPWPLTPEGHLGSKKIIPFESPYMTSYLTSMDNISLARTVFEILDFKVFRVWPWPLTPKDHLGSKKLYRSKAHIWLPIWLLWTTSLYLVPFSRYWTSKFLGFDLDLWPLKVFWGQKNIPFESPYMTSYLTPMDNISLARTVFEILDFKVFRVWPWPLTPKDHLGSKKLYRSKAHIWLPIWLLWTTSLYLVPFSRYSTSKFLGFDLDLWPLKAIWGRKKLYRSKGHIWLPIWLLWTTSLYLVPFSRYWTSKFWGFDLDLWPLKVIWGHKILYHSKAHIWLPIWLLWTTSLYLVPFSRYSTSKFLGFDLDLWPLKIFWGQKKYTVRKPIYDFLFDSYGQHLSISYRFRDIRLQSFLGFDLDLWPLKVIWGRKNSYHSKAHIWLPIWLLWTTSLYLVPFSRYWTSKFWGFDLDLWPLKVIWGHKILYHSKAHIWLPIWLQIWAFEWYIFLDPRWLLKVKRQGETHKTLKSNIE